jgi:hypothetical protein
VSRSGTAKATLSFEEAEEDGNELVELVRGERAVVAAV